MLKEGIGDDIYHTHYRNLSDGRWWSPDPLEYMFPSMSTYATMGNNPINFIDSNGDEKVAVVGGPDEANRNENNFYDTGLLKFDDYLNETKDSKEKVTVIFFNSHDNKNEVISAYKEVAGDRTNYELVFVNTAEDLTTYLNNGTTKSGNNKKRMNDPITSLSFFGHGYESSFEPGHTLTSNREFGQSDEQIIQSWGISEALKLDSKAFKNATIEIYSCNAAVPLSNSDVGLAGVLLLGTNSTIVAWKCQTTYINIYDLKPESIEEWLLNKIYGRSIRKADHLPKGSNNQKPIILKPSIK